MPEILGIGLGDDQQLLRDPQRTLAFQCKCGCELFNVDVEIYADYTWAALVICVACRQVCTPTEPVTNGLH